MICDYVRVSVPNTVADTVLGDLALVLNAAGLVAVTDVLWRDGSGGAFKIIPFAKFTLFSWSGSVLQTLRSSGLYESMFTPFVGVPHRVTRLDIAVDVAKPSPPILNRLYRKGVSGLVSLTRKTLQPHNVRRIQSPGLDGRDSGTVYFGGLRAEVTARVYDKAKQLFDTAGIVPAAPCTRFELTITDKSGAGLSDLFSPAAAFWHHMGDLLPRPASAPKWEKSSDTYDIPKRPKLLPYEILSRKVAESPEIGNLLSLASQCGPMGLESLIRKIRDRSDAMGRETGLVV